MVYKLVGVYGPVGAGKTTFIRSRLANQGPVPVHAVFEPERLESGSEMLTEMYANQSQKLNKELTVLLARNAALHKKLAELRMKGIEEAIIYVERLHLRTPEAPVDRILNEFVAVSSLSEAEKQMFLDYERDFDSRSLPEDAVICGPVYVTGGTREVLAQRIAQRNRCASEVADIRSPNSIIWRAANYLRDFWGYSDHADRESEAGIDWHHRSSPDITFI